MNKVFRAAIKDIIIIKPNVINDSRGYFLESFRNSFLQGVGCDTNFIQDNQVRSHKGALRGLHYQLKSPQGKLVWVSQGSVLDVAVDIRLNSPTFSKWFSIVLDDIKHTRIYIPPGFAHGYYVISEKSTFHYKCTNYYDPSDEFGISWDDPLLDINWPEGKKNISKKDLALPFLSNVNSKNLPKWNF